MLEHLDGMVVGGALVAALILAFLFHLAGNPTDKVEDRPEVPRRSPLAALRNHLRTQRELRASRRRAQVIARIELAQRRPE